MPATQATPRPIALWSSSKPWPRGVGLGHHAGILMVQKAPPEPSEKDLLMLRLLADGVRLEQVADELGVTHLTAKNRLGQLVRKLRKTGWLAEEAESSMTGAIALALRFGWIE